jgi:hypothetical protein
MLNTNGASSSIVRRTLKFSEFKKRTGRGGEEESSCTNVTWISVLLIAEMFWNVLLVLVLMTVLLLTNKYNTTNIQENYAHYEAV